MLERRLNVSKEKRKFTRITLSAPTTLSLHQIQAYHTGAIANISMSGCFFPFGEVLPQGEKCEVSITVGEAMEAEKVTMTGLVVRSDPTGVGIRFTNISSDNRHQLEKIIAHPLTTSNNFQPR